MIRFIFIFILFLASALGQAQAQVEREHPRVAELQDRLTEYARDYLQSRLQGTPFLVTVKVEALRRQRGSNYQPKNEILPYFDLSEMEIQDEWDDPSASLYTLQSRISKATVLVSLPNSFPEVEAQEIKDSLTVLLRLIPGRDEVRVERRQWNLGPSMWTQALMGIGLLVLFLLGLAAISRNWAKRLSRAISETKPADKKEADTPMTPLNPTTAREMGPEKQTGSGDLVFRDPIKMREFVTSRVGELLTKPGFPNLQAVIEMDRLAQSDPRSLGALLVEFPFEKQQELFSYSSGVAWLNAFSDPGEITRESTELLDRMIRLQYNELSAEWHKLLIQIWRLGDERVSFLKGLGKDDSFAILKAMPSSVALPSARLAFPGAWADLLDPNFKPVRISSEKIKEIYKRALEVKPYSDINSIERYRHEKDLLSYLKLATITEEKDIYGALPSDSPLWQVRAPFYQVVEAEENVLKDFVSTVSMDDWALALFNVSRDYRRNIESHFTQKQKYLFLSKLRQADQAGVDRRLVGEVRENVAKAFVSYKHKYQQKVDNTEKAYSETDQEKAA